MLRRSYPHSRRTYVRTNAKDKLRPFATNSAFLQRVQTLNRLLLSAPPNHSATRDLDLLFGCGPCRVAGFRHGGV